MISYLHDYLDKVYTKYKDKNVSKTINLDVVGFSRGAAEARMFASRVRDLMYQSGSKKFNLYKKGGVRGQQLVSSEKTWEYNKEFLATKCKVHFNFNYLGLWDTVPSYATAGDLFDGVNVLNDGIQLKNKGYALTVDSEWNRVAHAVAVNENRSGFPVRSIFKAGDNKNKSNRLELGFMGAHSDIGGGYAEGDLSDVALMWIINEARNAGISFTELDNEGKPVLDNEGKPVSTIPSKYKKVTEPIVHDSVKDSTGFRPSREFLWAEQNSHGPKQFVSQSHLKLNWANTLQFQPDRLTDFQKIKELTKGSVYTVPELQAYRKLKSENNYTILYDNSPGERIKISNYINWLKDKGYALGNNSNMLD